MICLKVFREHTQLISKTLNYDLKDELFRYMRSVTVLLNGNVEVYSFFMKNREYIKLIINSTNEFLDQVGLREWAVLAIRLFLESISKIDQESRTVIQELMGNNALAEKEILKNSYLKIKETEI